MLLLTQSGIPRSNAQYHEQRTAPSSVQFDADFIIEVILYALKDISSNP